MKPPLCQRQNSSGGRYRAAGLALVLLSCAAAVCAQAPVTLATGSPDGMYSQLARAVAEQHPALGLRLVATNGSGENLEKLSAGQVRFAFAQQDVVSEHFRNRPTTNVRVVGQIFFEYLHIFVRDPVSIDTMSDLGRLRIWVGEPGSGTRLTSSRFLDSLGMPLSSLEGREVRAAWGPAFPQDLSEEFRGDRLDVAMIVTTPGVQKVCKLMESGRAKLLSLDPRTLRELTTEEQTVFRRQTAIGRIPAHTYPNQPAPVATIAVPVLLLARANEDRKVAVSLLQTAQDAWKDFATAKPEGGGVCQIPDSFPEAASLKDSGLEPLQGIEFPDPFWPRTRRRVLLALVLCGLAAVGLWGFRRGWHVQARGLWRQDKLLLGLGIVLVTLTTYLLERGINEHFSTIRESFWSITVYLFSGLEDRTPYTDEGRVVATLGLLLGPAFFAVMSGWLARFFIHREKRMPHNLVHHFLLLNWNPRAADVVREIHHPIIREREGTFVVVVLTDDESLEIRRFKEAGSGRDEAFEDFYVSIGDPTDERALRNANAQDTRSILILTDDQHGDERTLRSILMLRKIAREVGRTDLHVVAELANPANGAVLDELAKDFPGLLERISGLQVRTSLLSQAALRAGIVSFFSDLLQISAESNEIYTLDLPPSAVGMPFREYAAMVLETDSREPLVPVGVQRMINGKSQMLTNPRHGEPGWVLEEGDRLLVLAYLPPLPNVLPMPRAAMKSA
jgi:TRAP transporter TAXI family solute receptor